MIPLFNFFNEDNKKNGFSSSDNLFTAFHCKCVDPWLTKRKKTCPCCKRRVIPGRDREESGSESENENDGDSPGETTPLLAGGSGQPSTSGGSTFEHSGTGGHLFTIHPHCELITLHLCLSYEHSRSNAYMNNYPKDRQGFLEILVYAWFKLSQCYCH